MTATTQAFGTAANPVYTAVIPVGGLGTRTFPASYGIPKNLLTSGDRPILQHAVEEAIEAGIRKVVIVCNPGDETIFRRHFRKDAELEVLLEKGRKTRELAAARQVASLVDKIVYVEQKEARGLGHAVLQAKEHVNSLPFAVILPDDYFYTGKHKGALAQMAEQYTAEGGNVVSVIQVEPSKIERYGMLKPAAEENGRLTLAGGLVEKPKTLEEAGGSTLAVIGRYVLDPSIMDVLETVPPGANGEIQLTDGINALIGLGQKVQGFRIRGHRFDYGTLEGRQEAEAVIACIEKPELADMAKRVSAFLADDTARVQPGLKL
jgi:UTP--glucose-1-phosphate uridylyltransferase